MEWLVYFVLLAVTLCGSAWWPHETHYSKFHSWAVSFQHFTHHT